MKLELLLAASLLVPSSANAVQPANAGMVQEARTPEQVGTAIAEALTPAAADAMVRGADAGLARELAANQDLVSLEIEYPGMRQAVHQAGLAAVERIAARAVPALISRISGLLAPELTLAELGEIETFYTRGAGQRIVAAEARTAAELAGMPAIENLGNLAAQGELRASDLLAAAGDPVRSLSPADRDALAAFRGTPAGRKFTALLPRITNAVADWTNEMVVGNRADVEAALLAAVQEFAARSRASR